jgi:hypothetical protein
VSEIPTPDTGCDRRLTGIEFSRRVRRVQLRDIVVAHLTRPRTPVPVGTSQTRAERNCTDSQEHYSTRNVATARTPVRRIPVGRWVLGKSYYVGTAGDVSTETIEQYIERAEHV